ncbi:metal-dependent hydrolase, partial [Rhizobium ruizarguesonis]
PNLGVENARIEDGEIVSLIRKNDRIAAIGPDAAAGIDPAVARFDAAGGLLCLPFVDGHLPLEKTLIGLPFLPTIPG